jgi:hypothetical protein
MVEVWIPMLDGRWEVLPRHTQPEPDVRAVLGQIRISPPSQPPPRIMSSQLSPRTTNESVLSQEPFQKKEGICRMRWLTLESKLLSAVAYDGSKQLLYLRFRRCLSLLSFPGCRISGLPRSRIEGPFFRSQVRDHFRHERMAKLHAA